MSKTKEKDKVTDNNIEDYIIIIMIVNLVVIGLLSFFLGEKIENALTNMEDLNNIQIFGFVSFILGLISYCFYLLSHLENKKTVLYKILLIFSMVTLLSQLIIFSIEYEMTNPRQYQCYLYSSVILSLINIFVIFALIEYFFVTVALKIFRKTFNFFKQSPERVSVILGFFGTIIAFLLKVLN